MINLHRLKNLENQRVSVPVETDRDAAKTSESADVFENIRSINQEIKQSITNEMKLQGLTDEDIRRVFHEIS